MNLENNKKVLDLIYSSIISEGGDGDAIWLSKHTTLNEIIKLINEYDVKRNTGWQLEENENYISWGINQEWAIITCDTNYFKSAPEYITLRIDY